MKTDGEKCIKERNDAFLWLCFPNSPKQRQGECIFLVFGGTEIERVTVMLSVLLYIISSVQIVYSVQLNCTDSNYTEDTATCSAAQQQGTFTVQLLYKLYSLQLNCTYSNYTEAAALCSAAQEERKSPAVVF
jgi:hypothetical protein